MLAVGLLLACWPASGVHLGFIWGSSAGHLVLALGWGVVHRVVDGRGLQLILGGRSDDLQSTDCGWCGVSGSRCSPQLAAAGWPRGGAGWVREVPVTAGLRVCAWLRGIRLAARRFVLGGLVGGSLVWAGDGGWRGPWGASERSERGCRARDAPQLRYRFRGMAVGLLGMGGWQSVRFLTRGRSYRLCCESGNAGHFSLYSRAKLVNDQQLLTS